MKNRHSDTSKLEGLDWIRSAKEGLCCSLTWCDFPGQLEMEDPDFWQGWCTVSTQQQTVHTKKYEKSSVRSFYLEASGWNIHLKNTLWIEATWKSENGEP